MENPEFFNLFGAPHYMVSADMIVEKSGYTKGCRPGFRIPAKETSTQFGIFNLNRLFVVDKECEHIPIRSIKTGICIAM